VASICLHIPRRFQVVQRTGYGEKEYHSIVFLSPEEQEKNAPAVSGILCPGLPTISRF